MKTLLLRLKLKKTKLFYFSIFAKKDENTTSVFRKNKIRGIGTSLSNFVAPLSKTTLVYAPLHMCFRNFFSEKIKSVVVTLILIL